MRVVLAGAALVFFAAFGTMSRQAFSTPVAYTVAPGMVQPVGTLATEAQLSGAYVVPERDTLASVGLLAGLGALVAVAGSALRKPSAVAASDGLAARRAARVAAAVQSGRPAAPVAARKAPFFKRAADVSMQVAAPVATPLKTVELKNAKGDTVTAYPFGACVTSYVKDGVDVLMVRPDAKLDGSKPISGGIPHCFPQFGPGEIQQHGFARNVDWAVKEQSDEKVVFELTENEYTLSMWQHKFCAKYTVTLGDDDLKTEFSVENTDDKSFSFTAALHTYWSISGVKNIKITSDAFDGATYLDKTASPPAETKSAGKEVTISKETDSVYAGVSGDVLLADTERKRPLKISNTLGWSDTVVWNPYGDEGMGYDQFVCVESAQASKAVVLKPGEYWTGAMNVVP